MLHGNKASRPLRQEIERDRGYIRKDLISRIRVWHHFCRKRSLKLDTPYTSEQNGIIDIVLSESQRRCSNTRSKRLRNAPSHPGLVPIIQPRRLNQAAAISQPRSVPSATINSGSLVNQLLESNMKQTILKIRIFSSIFLILRI